jgi:T4-like virus Myoviridae tail sheath stabiliser
MVTIFGSLFNNIYVLRKIKTETGEQVVSQTRVPLSYSPKRKYLDRINQVYETEGVDQLAIKLPRMGFEIISIAYDPSRQLPKMNTTRCGTFIDGDGSHRIKMYSPVPYNIQFQLNIYSKNQDDALQCIEQIIPFFNPQYSLTAKSIDGVENLTDDIPITLQTVTFTDDYEGPVEQRRTIIYSLDFEMKMFFRGPFDEKGKSIIREVNGIIYSMEGDQMEIVQVVPDPINALGHPDSDFGFSTNIIRLGDSV